MLSWEHLTRLASRSAREPYEPIQLLILHPIPFMSDKFKTIYCIVRFDLIVLGYALLQRSYVTKVVELCI